MMNGILVLLLCSALFQEKPMVLTLSHRSNTAANAFIKNHNEQYPAIDNQQPNAALHALMEAFNMPKMVINNPDTTTSDSNSKIDAVAVVITNDGNTDENKPQNTEEEKSSSSNELVDVIVSNSNNNSNDNNNNPTPTPTPTSIKFTKDQEKLHQLRDIFAGKAPPSLS